MKKIDWSQYPNFKESEFVCKETGEINMDEDFLARLQILREEFGKPMAITSGYRSPRHSIEAKKLSPGPHAHGKACDIAVGGEAAYELISIALRLGFTGIGVSQKSPNNRFIHLDTMPRSAVWSY